MGTTYRRCCGIDVHKKSVTVCVLPPAGKPDTAVRRRNFPTFTRDLRQLRTWLKNCKVTEIAMESTGQYWRAVWNILEGHFEKLILVNPQHIKGLNGHKTDPKDAQWIAGLRETGKLQGSLVPPRDIREPRDSDTAAGAFTRRREPDQEPDRAVVPGGKHQSVVGGDRRVRSVGRRMPKAIVEGKRNPGWMADYARGTLRGKRRELESALEGSFSDNRRWLLDKELRQLEWLEGQVQTIEQEIERRVEPFAEAIRRLLTIPGVERKTAWTVVAEVGVDMSVFEDSRHLASWSGLCPGNRESGGKRMSGRTRKAHRYVRRALCQAAWAASPTRNTFLSAFYRRIQVRKGAPKAVMAVAHHLITVIYNMLLRGEDYIELGADYYDRKNKPRVVSRLLSRLSKLGYFVELRPIAPDPPPSTPVAAFGEAAPDPETETPAPTTVRKRGRPCKCAERGMKCKHQTLYGVKSLNRQPSAPVRFS